MISISNFSLSEKSCTFMFGFTFVVTCFIWVSGLQGQGINHLFLKSCLIVILLLMGLQTAQGMLLPRYDVKNSVHYQVLSGMRFCNVKMLLESRL